MTRSASIATRARRWSALGLVAVPLISGTGVSSRLSLTPCAPRVTFLARGYGAPDDVALDGRRILFGDTAAGVVAAIDGRSERVIVRNLSVPEGIVVRGKNRIV